jgi:hypothetical protein
VWLQSGLALLCSSVISIVIIIVIVAELTVNLIKL